MSITITVPNDDHVALRAMAKALEEIAVARGAPAHSLQMTMGPICTVPMSPEQEEVLREKLKRIKDETRAKAYSTDPISQVVPAAETDTTSQQVESLADKFNVLKISEQYKTHPDTDSTGTPWDERIHSASKALNADGTWRLRRKPKDMDEMEWADHVEFIKTELQHGDAIREAMDKAERGETVYHTSEEVEQKMDEFMESVRQRAEPSVTPEGDDFHVDAGEVTEQQIAAIPVPPLPVPPAPPVFATVQEVDEPTMSFPEVMKFLTERHTRITNDQVLEIIGAMGLKNIMDLNTQPEYTGPFIARVKALLGE